MDFLQGCAGENAVGGGPFSRVDRCRGYLALRDCTLCVVVECSGLVTNCFVVDLCWYASSWCLSRVGSATANVDPVDYDCDNETGIGYHELLLVSRIRMTVRSVCSWYGRVGLYNRLGCGFATSLPAADWKEVQYRSRIEVHCRDPLPGSCGFCYVWLMKGGDPVSFYCLLN